MAELASREPLAEGQAASDAEEVVRAFLRSMESRDLAAAQSWLAPDFEMHFPGAAGMSQLSELVAWASGRYQSISKTVQGFETLAASGCNTVYCRGTLSGLWPDGYPFEEVRFIDRFEVRNGKIARQDVWNDLAEYRFARAS